MKEIDEYFMKSIGTSQKNFANFIKFNSDVYTDEELNDIDFLVQRVARICFCTQGILKQPNQII